jgi:GntR family transcriptional regulator, transcriptional repressor for pyruvate dehydrogenase complex
MFKKITETRSLSQRIETEIEDAIRVKKLKPDEKLPTEIELSKSYGVSRNALREALRSLDSKGLIRIEKGRGMYVNNYSLSQAVSSVNMYLEMNASKENLLQIIRLRQMFEPEIAAAASRNRTEEDLTVLREAIISMEKCPADALTQEALEDNKFHKLIAEASHNFSVLVVMNPIYSLMPKFVDFVYGKTENRKENTLKFHWEIFHAIEAKDELKVKEIMKEHLLFTEQTFMNSNKVNGLRN